MYISDSFVSRDGELATSHVVEAARADERQRMARDLHDTLAQGLAAITFQLHVIERQFGATLTAPVLQQLAAVRELSRENLCEARRCLGRLRSAEPATLEQEIGRLVDCHRRGGEQRIVFEACRTPAAPPSVCEELARIAQEALGNALRHARASRITVSLQPSKTGGIVLAIVDDGRGFDARDSNNGMGYGLCGMRERAAVVGASFDLCSRPGHGTRLEVRWEGSADVEHRQPS